MSGSNEEITTITRRARGERPERQVHRESNAPEIRVEIDDVPTIDPSEALAESQRILKETQTRADNESRLRREAEARVQQERQSAASRQHNDRQTLVTSAISTAESEIAAARTAYRAAREAGDLDAETEAQAHLAAASARFDRASSELEWLKGQQPATPQPQPGTGQPTTSPETQAWLDAHPAYYQDDEYQALAQFAHGKALHAGLKSGSKQYVDFIDNYLTNKYGEGHGQIGTPPTRQPVSSRGGEVAPTRRAPNSQANGFKTAKVRNVGEIHYLDGSDGRRVRMLPEMKAICEEYAKVCKMSLEDYVNDQILIAQEIESGGTGDIIYGDGRKHE